MLLLSDLKENVQLRVSKMESVSPLDSMNLVNSFHGSN